MAGSVLNSPHRVVAQLSPASTDLQTAKDALSQAYAAVSDSYKAGANVTSLVIELNAAADQLTQAERSYVRADFNLSMSLSADVLSACQRISAQAPQLKQATIDSNQNAFRNLVIFISAGLFGYLLSLYFLWRFVKQKYLKRILTAKPKVKDT